MGKLQAISQITFQLSELSAHNKQHEFEHLARHFARHKISSYILPATGPVQAGGDQGRDFDSFRSFIQNDTSKFVGLGSNQSRKLIFCCSLQKDFKSKIKTDVKSVLEFGLPVDIIYFFSSQNIPISKRNFLKKWCIDNYKIELEIIDRQAIAENLAEYDTFWIAQEFLSLPSSLVLRPDGENWYDQLFSKYNSEENQLTFTYEEFTDIKTAARHIYKSPEHKSDIVFWIKLIRQFAINGPLKRMQLKASYEAIVYSAVGLRDSSGCEDLFKNYIENIDEIVDPEQIEDATNFCIFYWKGINIGQLQDSLDTALSFEQKVSELLIKSLQCATTSDSKCYLMVVDAFWLRHANRELQNFINRSVEIISSILDLIESSLLYPVTNLSDALDRYLKLFLDEDFGGTLDLREFENLLQKVSKLSAVRYGQLEYARQLSSRAIIYAENENIVKALGLFHQAKLEYFKHESLDKVIRLCLHISNAYEKLGCHFASKYYALIAAYISTDLSNDKYLTYYTESMLLVAAQDYYVGNWIHYLDKCDNTMLIGSHLKKDYIYTHDDLNSIFFHSWLVKYIAGRFYPNSERLITDITDEWFFMKDDFEEADKNFSQKYDVFSDQEVKQKLKEQIVMYPFSDLGEKCSYAKRLFGIDWLIEFDNNFSNRCVAEHFIALLEIHSTLLADYDLYLIKNKVSIAISSSNEFKFTIDEHQDYINVLMNFPYDQEYRSFEFVEKTRQRCSSFIFTLYSLNSLLSKEEYNEIVKKVIDNSISSEFLFVAGFESLYRKYYDNEKIDGKNLELHDNPLRFEIPNQNHELFNWRDSLADKYNQKEAESHIKNRYRHSFEQVEITLPLLRNKLFFQEIKNDMKAKGFKDWHILLVLGNIVLNQKLDRKKIEQIGPEYFWKMAKRREKGFYKPVPEEIISLENMLNSWNKLVITLLNSYGLENNSRTPNFDSIQEFLKIRFNLFDDDVAHEDYF